MPERVYQATLTEHGVSGWSSVPESNRSTPFLPELGCVHFKTPFVLQGSEGETDYVGAAAIDTQTALVVVRVSPSREAHDYLVEGPGVPTSFRLVSSNSIADVSPAPSQRPADGSQWNAFEHKTAHGLETSGV